MADNIQTPAAPGSENETQQASPVTSRLATKFDPDDVKQRQAPPLRGPYGQPPPSSMTRNELSALLQQQEERFQSLMKRERKERDQDRAELMAEVSQLRRQRDRRGRSPSFDDNIVDGLSGTYGPKRRINVSSLEKLKGDVTLRDFVAWRCNWDDLYLLENIDEYPLKKQMAALRLVMSTAMLGTVKMLLGDTPAAETTPANILDLLQQHLRKQWSVALDRVEFENCKQAVGEKFDTFYQRLQKIAHCADLCSTCFDTRMTTRLMSGIRDEEIRKKLLALLPFPKLEDALNLCRTEENASKNAPLFNPSISVHQVNENKNRDRRNRSQSRRRPETDESLCGKCGYQQHPADRPCPAKGKECKSCKKFGHFESVCKSKKVKQVKATEGKGGKIGMIRVSNIISSRRAPTINVEICCKDGTFLATLTAVPDCGAEASIMSTSLLSLIGEDEMNMSHRGVDKLIAANGFPIKSCGRLNLRIHYKGSETTTPVIVCPEHDGMLLSWFACIELGILQPNFPEPIQNRVRQLKHERGEARAPEKNVSTPPQGPILPSQIAAIKELLLKEFKDVFDESGPLKTMDGPPMKIDLKPDAVPFSVNGCRPIPFNQQEKVKAMLDDMVTQGIIASVISPTDWVHPLVVFSKPNGGM